MTTRQVEKTMADRRSKEAENAELTRYASSNQQQTMANKSDMGVLAKRRNNQAFQRNAEAMLEERSIAVERDATRSQRTRDQNDFIAKALEEERRTQDRKEREIQRICESSEELRELESMLKVAYVNKERAVQQAERETLSQIEVAREKAIEVQMEYDRQRSLVDMAAKEFGKRVEAVASKQSIQQQMLDRLKLHEEAAREAEMDKHKVDTIMRKIEEEDRLEQEKRERYVLEAKKLIEDSKLQRSKLREAGIKEKLAEKKKREDELFLAVEAEIQRQRKEEDEFARLRDELWEEEVLEARRHKERERAQKKQADKEDMMRSNDQQQVLKAQLVAEQKRKEDEYNEFLKRKFASEERRAMEMDMFRRRQKEEYKLSIAAQNQHKQAMYHHELEKEREEAARIADEEAFKKAVVEEAKRRLLDEHAAKLHGYLPKGVAKEVYQRGHMGSR
ncbi:hypothetical protein DYB25_004235 [Aphanomyces astaci]|nr:hypothetical protein DYB25_004235 [Aphanomyces astaci]RHY39750.1 hypothetical protein DYB30_005027 [Aphanomyces astaci]RHY50619.1 hypothetical protein DYB38_001589 [Aphanomyces astaci]RHY59811.1 hypothetical protein DYB34_005156 [Aphanomyces astaci]RQM21117.1 hypothetical protein B5M09_009016 [Aphanomyces astaci]